MSSRGIARSVRLLSAFRHEGTDPDRFGRTMAEDTVNIVQRYVSLEGRSVVDVGGASGYVAEAFRGVGARAFTVEYDPVEMHLDGHEFSGGMRADGRRLPLATGSVDVCYSSNVIEHVDGPSRMLEEMVRVVRPGGLVIVAFTNWWSPWGGHETSPWHWMGGARAVTRYEKRYGRPPKNYFARSLFPLHISDLMRWARSNREVTVVEAFPRYYPSWCKGLVRVPLLREVATWNLALAMEKRVA